MHAESEGHRTAPKRESCAVADASQPVRRMIHPLAASSASISLSGFGFLVRLIVYFTLLSREVADELCLYAVKETTNAVWCENVLLNAYLKRVECTDHRVGLLWQRHYCRDFEMLVRL